MYNREFQEKLRKALTTLGETTIYEILKEDIQYQEDSEAEDKAEEEYLKICQSLTKEQERVIYQFICCRDTTNAGYTVAAYLAGMKDMCRILCYLNIIKEV